MPRHLFYLVVGACALVAPLEAQEPAAAVDASNAPVAATVPPVDWHVRTGVYLRKLVSLQAIYETIPGTIFDETRNYPSAWGRGPTAFTMRTASQYGQFLVSESIEFGLSAVHREDPRYFRRGEGSTLARLGHALETAVIVNDTKGGRTLAVGRIAGVFGARLVAQRWEPSEDQTIGNEILWGGFGLLTKAGANVFREFWPDIKHKFGHH